MRLVPLPTKASKLLYEGERIRNRMLTVRLARLLHVVVANHSVEADLVPENILIPHVDLRDGQRHQELLGIGRVGNQCSDHAANVTEERLPRRTWIVGGFLVRGGAFQPDSITRRSKHSFSAESGQSVISFNVTGLPWASVTAVLSHLSVFDL